MRNKTIINFSKKNSFTIFAESFNSTIMTKEFIAYVSLGFGCGPEMGEYGKFSVDLTTEECDALDRIATDDNIKGWKRNAVSELYPALDEKIRQAGQNLVEQVSLMDIVRDSRQYMDIEALIRADLSFGFTPKSEDVNLSDPSLIKDWETWEEEKIKNADSETKFNYVKSRYGIVEDVELEDICGELCYYICDSEIPSNYKG